MTLALLLSSGVNAADYEYKLNTSLASSGNNYDNSCQTDGGKYYSSLKAIYGCLANEDLTNKSVDILVSGDNNHIADSVLNWRISGSKNYPITIKTETGQSKATLSASYDENRYKIRFVDVSYIHIDNLKLKNFGVGLYLENVDNSKITNSDFLKDRLWGPAGAGSLWIGVGANDVGVDYSENNLVENNTFVELEIENFCTQSKYHNIYVSRGNKNTSIINNYFNVKSSGVAISFNHGYQLDNTVANNHFRMTYRESQSWQNTDDCPVPLLQSNGWSTAVDAGGAIGLRIQNASTDTVKGNKFLKNFVETNVAIYLDDDNITSGYGLEGKIDIQYYRSLFDQNTFSGNRLFDWLSNT